jgi:hypothetical protein
VAPPWEVARVRERTEDARVEALLMVSERVREWKLVRSDLRRGFNEVLGCAW